MKKKIAILLSICLIVISFTACGSSNSIVGKWQDDQDTVVFSSKGTLNSGYYWGNKQLK